MGSSNFEPPEQRLARLQAVIDMGRASPSLKYCFDPSAAEQMFLRLLDGLLGCIPDPVHHTSSCPVKG